MSRYSLSGLFTRAVEEIGFSTKQPATSASSRREIFSTLGTVSHFKICLKHPNQTSIGVQTVDILSIVFGLEYSSDKHLLIFFQL